jgi:WD repeat-containing protein 19
MIQIWDQFTQKALEHLEVEIAIKSCQQSKNIKMLPYLHHIAEVENRALLAGHIFLLFGDHDAAEVLIFNLY